MVGVYGAKDSSLQSDYDNSSDDNFKSSLAGSIGILNVDDQSPIRSENSVDQSEDLVTIMLRSTLYDWWLQVLADYTSRNLSRPTNLQPFLVSPKNSTRPFLNERGILDTYLARI
jgi:hypothetical protein